ncbi:hypothetical protein N7474_006322 [Penicillium riverlandense]|uniref:uncharacterized protein n=1 Tax=Penicillium riverlandense TaxID=1903569 RepID=UPI00254988D5|nr:uncharacterized protein N7474_006322 [Penicillium riverlandense]KAJ5814545.1 hypothetical protein N7474_006322 [Penicillium riverlandense]
MPGVPSNKACERCKKRHLKCDETRPGCQRCIAAGVDCPGYVQMRKFIDQGASVRRRYAPYQESHPKNVNVSTASKKQHSEANEQRNTQSPEMAKDNPTLHLQMEEAKLDSQTSPRDTDDMPGPAMTPGAVQSLYSGVPVFGGEGSGSTRSTIYSLASPIASTGALTSNEHSPPNRPGVTRLVTSESLSQRSEKEEFQDIFSELMTGTEHETAFLTRYYSDVLGPWLDLSDSGKFFAVYVPIRAINNQSLKYAIAALAAKHLGQVKGAKLPAGSGMFTSPAIMETYPNSTQVDWFLKAANYYYLAVSELNTATSDGYMSVSSSAVLGSPIETLGRWLNSDSTQSGLDLASNAPFTANLLRKTEELLAVVVLLTFYRLMDISGDEWHEQLTGIKSLFDSLTHVHMTSSAMFCHGVRAAFWNFARQDYLGSYFTRSPTHLDPENLFLWRTAGISINSQDSKFHINTSAVYAVSQEDQAANGLIWLINKVINFLARSKQSQLAQWAGSPHPESPETQAADIDTWLKLCFDLQTWFEGVPETFRPCVRIEHPKDHSKPSEKSSLPFPEVFHGLTTCAAAMQHYHFGRIALLLNRPPDVVSAPSTAFDRLQGYREVTKEVEYRCREVCGIALGRPQGGLRIYMVPLLYAVGQCLENAAEHDIIVDLLRGVEADLGWATEYAVQKLQASWSR